MRYLRQLSIAQKLNIDFLVVLNVYWVFFHESLFIFRLVDVLCGQITAAGEQVAECRVARSRGVVEIGHLDSVRVRA